jgi:hypothetical protein
MTLKRILVSIITLILLCSAVTAIAVLKDGPPANLSPAANVTVGEYIQEKPETQAHPIKISIERVHPATSTPGTEITITLKVSNQNNERVRAKVFEDQRLGLTYLDSYEMRYHNYQAIRIPYYVWDITLEPGSSKTITYRVKPDAVGIIAFTQAMLIDEFGNQVEAAQTSIKISCIPNGVCDAGENTIYCPQDCPSGGADGICDGIPDAKVDPDCQPGFDPDATSTPVPTPTTKSPIGAYLVVIAVPGALAAFLLKRRGCLISE